MKNSMPLEKIAADIYALVAGDAPQGFEQLVSVQFVRRQRGCISFQPAIEAAVWRYQRSLEAGDGVQDVLVVRATPVRSHEVPARGWVRGVLFRQLRKTSPQYLAALL